MFRTAEPLTPLMSSVPFGVTVIETIDVQFPVSSTIVSGVPVGNELAAGRLTTRAAVSAV